MKSLLATATVLLASLELCAGSNTTLNTTNGERNTVIYITTALYEWDLNTFVTDKWAYLQNNTNGDEVDLWMLGFVRAYEPNPNDEKDRGVFYTVQDNATGQKVLQNVDRDLEAWDETWVRTMLDEHYVEGKTHLVFGVHGQGDFFWINNYTQDGGDTYYDDASVPLQTIIPSLGNRTFLSVTMDACLMAEVYTLARFSTVTPLVAAAQGWMWGEDWDFDQTIFSATAANAMGNPDNTPLEALHVMQNHYLTVGNPSGLADLGIYNATAGRQLLNYWLETPALYQILQDRIDTIYETNSTDFGPYIFYTVETEEDTYDAQYLPDVGLIMQDFPEDETLQRLVGETIIDHQGPFEGPDGEPSWGEGSLTDYNFDISGLAITCVHIPLSNTSQVQVEVDPSENQTVPMEPCTQDDEEPGTAVGRSAPCLPVNGEDEGTTMDSDGDNTDTKEDDEEELPSIGEDLSDEIVSGSAKTTLSLMVGTSALLAYIYQCLL